MTRVRKSATNNARHGFMVMMETSRPANLFRLCLLWCFLFPAIGSLSLKPPAEEILNKHLCPNPVLSSTSKLHPSELSKIIPARLQPRTGTNTYFSRLIRPCTFVEDPALATPPASVPIIPPPQSDTSISNNNNANSTIIRIQSINLNISPWNFSTATSECSKFVMFRSWTEYGNGYPVMCGRENFDQFLGPYGHPMILYYHLRDEGMSFPLFHPNYEPLSSFSSYSSSSSPGGSRRDQQRSILELKYMLIYYSLRNPDGKWTCRIQQYTINPMQDACPAQTSSLPPSPSICGEYQCGELDALYQKKMGGSQGEGADFQQQRFILVKSKTQEQYRVKHFLRQKFIPIVFLVLLICGYKTYMKAGLRMHEQMPMPVSETRLRRYNSQRHSYHHHHGRDPFRDIYFDHHEDNNIPVGLHIPYEPTSPAGVGVVVGRSDERGPGGNGESVNCSHGKSLVHATDPPPSYETLFPPSYNELFHSTAQTTTTPTETCNAANDADDKNPKV